MTIRLPLLLLLLAHSVAAQGRPVRARDLGVPFDGSPGPLNAITDVKGVTVGHATIVRGAGRLRVGEGPVRTGVTAIFPRGRDNPAPVFAGWFNLNGNGEMTGTAWIEDYGQLAYPITITNTNSVGTVRDAVIAWGRKQIPDDAFNCCLPVVAETWDGYLNDIFGFHVTKEHVFAALDGATAGPVLEGSVGGGTGMRCFSYKGGIGSASRRVRIAGGTYTVGVLVQCNLGRGDLLRIAGVPVGQEITDVRPCYDTREPLDSVRATQRCPRGVTGPDTDHGSIIVVVATDAPLLPHQLKRVARRGALGVGRMGGVAGLDSGELMIAFSTSSVGSADSTGVATVRMLTEPAIDPVYEATVQATEEAITNAMVAARTMTGADYYRVPALPHEKLREVLARHGRLRN